MLPRRPWATSHSWRCAPGTLTFTLTLTPTLTQAGLNHLRPIGEGAACLRAARALLASEEQGEEHEGEEQREEQGEVELRLRMGGATLAD